MDLGNTLQSFAVLQRTNENVSNHPFTGSARHDGEVLLTIENSDGIVNAFDKIIAGKVRNGRVKGVIAGLPVGGPYTITLQISGSSEKAVFKEILVGDLWLLAGQSNMADYGMLPSLTRTDPMVHAYYMTDTWGIAQAPLHDTNRAVAPVHGGNPGNKPKTSGGRGAGPGLAFAAAMFKATSIPQGVIACAHGGTSLEQWSPALKKLGGKSLYGAMYERLQAAGGRVAGLLWYQGCNDTAKDELSEQYMTRTLKLFRAVRKDCCNAKLPIVFVQLAGFIANYGDTTFSSRRWLQVRNQQYLLGLKLKNSACVPAIDLGLCDHIHLSNEGAAALGKRLAEAMLSLIEPEKYPGQIKVKSLKIKNKNDAGNAVVELTFDNVCGKLTAQGGAPCGFCLTDKAGNYISDAINCHLSGDRATVLLKVPAIYFSEKYQIAYGGSFQPHANIVDSMNRSLPCFAMTGKPRPVNETAYVEDVLVSKPFYGSEELSELNLPEKEVWEKINFTRAANSMIYVTCPAPEKGSDAKAQRKYYFKFQTELPEKMILKVLFGSDAPFALYCDKKVVLQKSTTNPVVLDEFIHTMELAAGKHEFVVVFASNCGKGWGWCCRFVRLDGRKAPGLLSCCDFIS